MIVQGQTPLPGDIGSATFRQELQNCWIETVEEFLALKPVLDQVNPEFMLKWHGVHAKINGPDLAVSSPVDISALPLGDSVPDEYLTLFQKEQELRHANQIDLSSTEDAFPKTCFLNRTISSIANQGEEGACAAYAVASLVEHVLESPEPLSADFLYQECKGSDGRRDSQGTMLRLAMDVASRTGICPARLFSISEEDFQEPDIERCRVEARRMANSRPVNPGVITNFQRILTGADGTVPMPIAVTLLVFDSWYCSRSTRRTGKWTLPLDGESPNHCGHAVLIVGYRDDASVPGGGFFIARNSWGESWAEASPVAKPGHALIPYTYTQRFACEAFTGPEIELRLKLDTENRRDCLGAKHPKGTPILVNPEYPEDFMADTHENRELFQKYNFVWKEKNRYKLAKKAIDEMYRKGHGAEGQASIRVKDIVEKTGFETNEIVRLFGLLARKEDYEIGETEYGDVTIRRPGK